VRRSAAWHPCLPGTHLPIHPLLLPGLDAWRQRDFAAAGQLWEELAGELEDDSAATCRVLSRIALALAAAGNGEQEVADDRWAQAKLELAALPSRHLGVDLAHLDRCLPLRAEAALPSPPLIRSPSRFPRRAVLRFVLFVGIVVVAALLVRFTPLGHYLTKEAVLAFVSGLREAWWSPLLLIALGAALYPLGLPATPLMVAGSLVFGAVEGSLYNFLSTYAGALSGYWMARTLGSDLLRHIAGARLKLLEKQLARRGFGYLVVTRFLPLPFPAVNFGMALAGIRFWPYAISSAIGLAPAITVWTIFYASLGDIMASEEGLTGSGETRQLVFRLAVVMFLLAFFSLLPNRLNQLGRRRRYRKLLAERRERRG